MEELKRLVEKANKQEVSNLAITAKEGLAIHKSLIANKNYPKLKKGKIDCDSSSTILIIKYSSKDHNYVDKKDAENNSKKVAEEFKNLVKSEFFNYSFNHAFQFNMSLSDKDIQNKIKDTNNYLINNMKTFTIKSWSKQDGDTYSPAIEVAIKLTE